MAWKELIPEWRSNVSEPNNENKSPNSVAALMRDEMLILQAPSKNLKSPDDWSPTLWVIPFHVKTLT